MSRHLPTTTLLSFIEEIGLLKLTETLQAVCAFELEGLHAAIELLSRVWRAFTAKECRMDVETTRNNGADSSSR